MRIGNGPRSLTQRGALREIETTLRSRDGYSYRNFPAAIRSTSTASRRSSALRLRQKALSCRTCSAWFVIVNRRFRTLSLPKCGHRRKVLALSRALVARSLAARCGIVCGQAERGGNAKIGRALPARRTWLTRWTRWLSRRIDGTNGMLQELGAS